MADPIEEQNKTQLEGKAQQGKPAKTAPGGQPSAGEIAKAIAGLVYRTNKGIPVRDDSTGKPVMEGGKPKVRYVPDERPMKPEDVLSAAYAGAGFVIVAKDGSKHRVGK